MADVIDTKTVLELFEQFKSIVLTFTQLGSTINTSLGKLSASIDGLYGNLEDNLKCLGDIQSSLEELERKLNNILTHQLSTKLNDLDIKEIHKALKTIETSLQVYNDNLQCIQELATHISSISIAREQTAQTKLSVYKDFGLKILGLIGGAAGGVFAIWKLFLQK